MNHLKELGNSIANGRKQKGWTQEELAEKCSISTRTLQRIEAGTVKPRTYALNCLAEVLGIPREDYIALSVNLNESQSFFKKCKYLVNNIISPENVYTTAWIAALICLVLTIPDIIFEIISEDAFEELSFVVGYTLFNLLFIIPLILRMRGFIALARHFNNDLLLVSSYFLLFLDIIHRISSVTFNHFWSDNLEKVIGVVSLALVGFGLILYGIGLKRLQKIPISYARIAGVLSIITGITFVLVVPFLLGLMLLIPLALAEILMLYKVSKQLS
jgi:transcriptional regulator with XRE-family HTH domain